MKAARTWLLLLVTSQLTLSDCSPQYAAYGGAYFQRAYGSCVGKLSLYQGGSFMGQIE